MGEAPKPLSATEEEAMRRPDGWDDCVAGLFATLDAARAEHMRLRHYVQSTLDCSYGETDGGIHCPLEVPCDKCKREKELDAAQQEVERLREALQRYGGHERNCHIAPACTCGYRAALASSPPGEKK